jgi:hypothetical protein
MTGFDSINKGLDGGSGAEVQPPSEGVVPFATEVCRYFMDFLETDFHKVRNLFILMNTTHLVKHAKGRRKECWKRQLKQWRQNMHADLNISMCVILNCHG